MLNMEKFLSIATVTERSLANQMCAVLEEAKIAVMLEHVEVVNKVSRESGFRILVPMQFMQRSIRLFQLTSTAFYNREHGLPIAAVG